jgi:hypothetical protein
MNYNKRSEYEHIDRMLEILTNSEKQQKHTEIKKDSFNPYMALGILFGVWLILFTVGITYSILDERPSQCEEMGGTWISRESICVSEINLTE